MFFPTFSYLATRVLYYFHQLLDKCNLNFFLVTQRYQGTLSLGKAKIGMRVYFSFRKYPELTDRLTLLTKQSLYLMQTKVYHILEQKRYFLCSSFQVLLLVFHINFQVF